MPKFLSPGNSTGIFFQKVARKKENEILFFLAGFGVVQRLHVLLVNKIKNKRGDEDEHDDSHHVMEEETPL